MMHVGTVEQRQPPEELMTDSLKRSALILFQAWHVVLTPMPAWAEEAAASTRKESAALEHAQPQGERVTATAPSRMPSGHHCFDNPKLPRRSSKKPKTITTAQSAR
jgi:hypothetical protein